MKTIVPANLTVPSAPSASPGPATMGRDRR
jgi:hypothetical protein